MSKITFDVLLSPGGWTVYYYWGAYETRKKRNMIFSAVAKRLNKPISKVRREFTLVHMGRNP